MFNKLAVLALLLLAATNIACEPGRSIKDRAPDMEVTALANGFIKCLVEEDFSKATGYFNAQMKRVAPDSSLQRRWEGTIEQLGPYHGIFNKEVEAVNTNQAVNVITCFAEGQLNIRILFDSDNLITGLWFKPLE